MTNSELIALKTGAISEDVRRQGVALSVMALATVLRIYAISLYPIAGDEYGSLAEAKAVGLNWNSIIYSSLMHFWIRLGTSEMWLRLPSAIFGVATVAILFKIGERLGGWRTGVVAGLLAATSPFNIYHSQEVRFYSLFILASAAFMLATVQYVDTTQTLRPRVAVLLTGALLVLAHFLGVLALYAQATGTAFAKKSRWSKRTLLLVLFGVPVVASALVLTPLVRHDLWRLYHLYGNAPSSVEPVMTPVSIVSFAKVGFAGFVFIFGYHVYPLRLVLVVAGISLSGFLLLVGVRRLWKGTQWSVLPFAYLLALLAIYVVLDAVGGRVAAGVSPRHVAFVWPVFVLLTAIGAASFKRPVIYVLVAAVLTVNAFSIWSGWTKDWTYGISTDYRSAAEYASRWTGRDTAVFHDGRSLDTINFYFPRGVPLINSWPYLQNRDLIPQLSNQRLIFVTDDWEPVRRRGFDQLMERLREGYSVVDGHVDYPLFEYVLDRKPLPDLSGYGLRAGTSQVQQPLSFYGLEFQDLRLPVSVKVKDVPLTVIGAYGLPDLEGRRELSIPLRHSTIARRVVLLSNIVEAGGLRSGQQVAEISIENKAGKTLTFPLHLGGETASWDKHCDPAAPCATVFQWRKRIAIASQSGYEGALRDFPAGLHSVVFDLPEPQEAVKVTIRFTADHGRLFTWGLALPGD